MLMEITQRLSIDILSQQTDFPLSLIKPDPKLHTFTPSGNTKPLSERRAPIHGNRTGFVSLEGSRY